MHHRGRSGIAYGKPLVRTSQSSEDRNTYSDNVTHLCIINLARAEQRVQRVITWDQKSGEVDKEFASDVEEDEEEVETKQAEENIDLGNVGLFFKVVENGILGKLFWC